MGAVRPLGWPDSGWGCEVSAEFTEGIGLEYFGVIDGSYTIELELRPDHMRRAERADA